MSTVTYDCAPGLVSIVMPSYNCDRYIASAIDSVLIQTYTNWELLICDDCSNDRTLEIIKEYSAKDGRITVISNEKNSGAAVSRNRCIDLARGEWIAFLDSDDMWFPQKLEVQLRNATRLGFVFSSTSYYEVDESGNTITSIVSPYSEAGYWKILFSGNPLGNSTVIFRAGKIGKYYAPQVEKRNDFALWLRIAKSGISAHGISEPLALYRVRRGSLSSRKWALLSYQWSLYRSVENLSFAISVVAMGTWMVSKLVKLRKHALNTPLKEVEVER